MAKTLLPINDDDLNKTYANEFILVFILILYFKINSIEKLCVSMQEFK